MAQALHFPFNRYFLMPLERSTVNVFNKSKTKFIPSSNDQRVIKWWGIWKEGDAVFARFSPGKRAC